MINGIEWFQERYILMLLVFLNNFHISFMHLRIKKLII